MAKKKDEELEGLNEDALRAKAKELAHIIGELEADEKKRVAEYQKGVQPMKAKLRAVHGRLTTLSLNKGA